MANTFLTPTMIANEALMVLQNSLVMAGLVHRDYSPEFVHVGDTVTVRKPATFIAKNFTGTTQAQNATESSVDVKLDRFRDVTVDVTSQDLTLEIGSFSTQVVQPAMQAIAQAIDCDVMALGIEKAGKSVTGTDSPTNISDIGNIAKALDISKAPMANRRLVLNPTHKYRYLTLDTLTGADKSGSTAALREASLGRLYGFDTYMSQNALDTSATTAGTATAYKVTAVKGETHVALTSMSAAKATVLTGDGFILGGYFYRVTGDFTGSGSAVDNVTIDQPLHGDYTTEAVYVIRDTHSLGFHRNGIALVTRQLELPMGAAKAAVASADGIAVRVVFGYNMSTKVDTISFDTLYGVKELDTSLIVKLVS